MATITKKKVLTELSAAGISPFGNAVVLPFTFETNSSGVYANSDTATAVGNGDVVRIGVIPAGTRLIDGLAIISDAFRASSTFKIGFAYVDGSDSTDVPQDDDYFFAALAADAAGRTRATNTAVRPVVLPKDAYVIVTNGGAAAQNVAGQLDFYIQGATA